MINRFCILLLALMAFGCSNKNTLEEKSSQANNVSISNNPQKPVRIMGHWYGEGKKELLVQEMVREFSMLNQDLSIEMLFPQQFLKYKEESELYFVECDTIEQMVRKNTWPFEVLFCDQERYKKIGQQLNDPDWGEKYLVDFSNEPWFKHAHKDGLIETMNLKARYGNIMPGIVLEGITNILFVSEYVENKLGIKVKDLDMTFDDFIAYAQAVDNYNKTHSDKISFLSQQYQTVNDILFTQLATSIFEGSKYESREKGIAALKKAFEEFEKLSKYNPTKQYMDYSKFTYDEAQRILYDKQCLFTMNPTWMILLWLKSYPEGTKQMRPCEIPSFAGKKSPFYSGFYQVIFVVAKNSKNPEAGRRFMKYMASTEIADKWVNYSSCPTGMRTSISYTDFGQNKYEKFFQHIQKKYGNNQAEVSLPKLFFNSNITSYVSYGLNELLTGKINANEAYQKAMRQIK